MSSFPDVVSENEGGIVPPFPAAAIIAPGHQYIFNSLGTASFHPQYGRVHQLFQGRRGTPRFLDPLGMVDEYYTIVIHTISVVFFLWEVTQVL